jgi:hypothetical protein
MAAEAPIITRYLRMRKQVSCLVNTRYLRMQKQASVYLSLDIYLHMRKQVSC